MSTAPAPITYAPPLLWAAVRALTTTIFALFGEPGAIAAQHTHRVLPSPAWAGEGVGEGDG